MAKRRDDANTTVTERIERLRIRAKMRSAGEEEISTVIQEEALAARQKPPSSAPAPTKWLVAVLNTRPSNGAVVVALALIGLVAFAIGRGVKLW